MGKAWYNFRQFLASKRGQTLFNILYSWGAAVVILGAMFKIMHYQGGNEILMIGMIVEVIVFIAAGFDYTSATSEGVGANALSGVIIGGISSSDESKINANTGTGKPADGKTSSGGSGSPVVVIGGSGNAAVAAQNNTAAATSGVQSTPASGGTVVGRGNNNNIVSSGVATGVGDTQMPPEYAQSLSNTAQNLDEFSSTIHSLNEASQKLLGAYQNITETQGFADNLVTLNQNVSGINELFNSQLQTITEQMSAVKYINDSLQRMRNLYDGAIGDSYMFREESAKMTKHIEALNNVYSRLLQAMTSNNNNNMNHNNNF